MHSIVTTFRGAIIKVKVANFCATMDTLIDQDEFYHACPIPAHKLSQSLPDIFESGRIGTGPKNNFLLKPVSNVGTNVCEELKYL